MKKLITLTFAASIGVGAVIFAQAAEKKLPIPAKGDCPKDAELRANDQWREHVGGPPPGSFVGAHFSMPYAGSQVLTQSPSRNNYIWMTAHTNQGWTLKSGSGVSNSACFALGTIAIYVDSSPPKADMLNNGEKNEHGYLSSGTLQLIELRWYDPRDGFRHRWYDQSLGRKIGYKGSKSPFQAPWAYNSLY